MFSSSSQVSAKAALFLFCYWEIYVFDIHPGKFVIQLKSSSASKVYFILLHNSHVNLLLLSRFTKASISSVNT